MSKRMRDTDYLAISARIRAMENSLLTADRMEQLLQARTEEEVSKLLEESGYPPLRAEDPAAMDAALLAVREETLQDVGSGAPDPRYLDIFKLKYDYHNVKAILKARAVNADSEHMLMDLGRVPAAELKEAVDGGDAGNLPPTLAAAIAEAKETLDTTRDPQLSDIVLDRWTYRDMMESAERTGSRFLQGYVRTQIDASNLRALVRTLRMGKSPEFLRNALLSGGTVGEGELMAAAENRGAGLEELFVPAGLGEAAAAGEAVLRDGSMTVFEKRCDDAVSAYLDGAKMIPFGEAPLIGYLAARETEYTNLRILLMGRAAGLSPEVIRSRLRAVD